MWFLKIRNYEVNVGVIPSIHSVGQSMTFLYRNHMHNPSINQYIASTVESGMELLLMKQHHILLYAGHLASSYSWMASTSSSLSTSIQERFLALGKSFPRAPRVKGRRLILSDNLVDVAGVHLPSELKEIPGRHVAPSSEESSGWPSLRAAFVAFRGRPLPRLPEADACRRFGGLPLPRRGFSSAGGVGLFFETFAGQFSASPATEGRLDAVPGKDEREGFSLWLGSGILSWTSQPLSAGVSFFERLLSSFFEESSSWGLSSPPWSFWLGLTKVRV